MPSQLLADLDSLVTAVKHQKLDLEPGDASQDEAIRSAAAAAARHFERVTRWSLLAQTGVIELHREVRLGRPFVLRRRPVTAVTLVEGRHLDGGTAFTALDHDLIDATEGEIVIVGSLSGGSWPPREGGIAARWFNWREPWWPLVRVTYDAGQASLDKDIEDAAIELAAHWYQLDRVGALRSASVSGVSESYTDRPEPPRVRAVLAPYRRAARSA